MFGNSDDMSNDVEEKIFWKLVDEVLSVSAEERFDMDQYIEAEIEKDIPKTVRDFYPLTPDPPIALSLPLEVYASQYHNPGYRTLVLKRRGSKLEADPGDRNWRFVMAFGHVSGEFFVARRLDADTGNFENKKAQVRIGVEGEVECLGIVFEEGMGDEMIWFCRMKETDARDHSPRQPV